MCASDFDVCHLDPEMISHLVVYHKGLHITAFILLLFLQHVALPFLIMTDTILG